MPKVTCDYMMSDDDAAKIEIRTIPGGSVPDFPCLQLGPVTIYSSLHQLAEMWCSIEDYLVSVGYYVDFDDIDGPPIPAEAATGAVLDVGDLFNAEMA
jgi:hypothetical protein